MNADDSPDESGSEEYHSISSGSDECSERDEDEDWHEFSEELLLGLKRNDPSVTRVWMPFESNSYYSRRCDWVTEGKWIGQNIHLKRLDVTDLLLDERDDSYDYDRQQFEAFCRGLSLNRSINRLHMENLRHFGNDSTFMTIFPFIQHNHQLRYLEINNCPDTCCDENVRSIVLALSNCNKCTLWGFSFWGNQLIDEWAGKLIESLDDHRNLTKLLISGNRIGIIGCAALAGLLQNPTSKLKELDIGNNHIDDECCVTFLAGAFAKNTSLKKLSLGNNGSLSQGRQRGCSISSAGWKALFTSFPNQNSVLEELDLADNSIDDEGATELEKALAISTTKTLHLDSPSLTIIGWRTVAGIFGLETLNINYNNIDDETATAIAHALANSTALRTLTFEVNRSITSPGWRSFFVSLQNSVLSLEVLNLACNNIDDQGAGALTNLLLHNNRIQRIHLGGNRIGDEGLALLADAFVDCIMLESVDLCRNRFITHRGWKVLSTILQSPNTSLKELTIGPYNDSNDEVAVAFANALENNNSLKSLDLGCQFSERGCASFTDILCNKADIIGTYRSNHTLREIRPMKRNYVFLNHNLQLNRNSNKFEAARRKILVQHFSVYCDVRNNVFAKMNTKIMPHAIAWISMDDTGHDLLYRVSQSMPSLFDVERKISGAKRKKGLGTFVVVEDYQSPCN